MINNLSNQLHPHVFNNSYNKSTRDGFGEALVENANRDPNIVVLTADLKESTRVLDFSNIFKDRFIEVGVAEQNLAGVAAGLALSGKTSVMTSYCVFSPGRNWDQIRVSICYSNSNVKIVSSHAGLAVGPDGATHMGLEDIALTRVLPNLQVFSPCDFNEAKKIINTILQNDNPSYVRLCKEETPLILTEDTEFRIGQTYKLVEGKDVTVLGTGPIIYEALLAAKDILERKNISVELINCPTIKPIDDTMIIDSVKKTGRVITIEDHQVSAGFGSTIAEILSQKYPTKMKIMGVNNTFAESGSYDQLKKKYGLKSSNIITEIEKILEK